MSESRNRRPEDLVQFANHPSKSDLAQAVTIPSFENDQPHADNQLSYPQRIVTSVEGIRVDIENSQWQPDAGPSESLGNTDEQSTRGMTDYYSQDGDWREQLHFSDHEREFLESQNGSLQTFLDINLYINFSPQNTPSIASPPSGQYPGQDSLAHLVDIPRASTPLQNINKSANYSSLSSDLHIDQPAINIWHDAGMPDLGKIWNAHGQEDRTVNPRDLLQTPVQNYCTRVDYSAVQDYNAVQDYSAVQDHSAVQDYNTGVEHSAVQDYSTVKGSRNVEDPGL